MWSAPLPLKGKAAGMAGNDVAKNALQKAKIPILGNVDPYITQTVPSLTTGTRANGAVNGASQGVTYANVKSSYSQTLSLDGIGSTATVKAGEVFTIAGVYAVNPRTKAALPYLQQFTVITGGTSVATATADNQNLDPTISPPIISAQGATTAELQYQNCVVNTAASNSAIVFLNTVTATQNPFWVEGAVELLAGTFNPPSDANVK